MAIKSPKDAVSGLWKDYAPWFLIMAFVYILWSFRKVFSSVGDAAGEAVGAAVATTQAAAQTKADQVKVQQATGSKTTAYSPSQLATFREDATHLAGYFGQLSFGMSTVFKDQQSAFSLIKQKYSRLNLHNNKPWKWKDKVKRTGVVPQTAETADSVKNPYNYKVLAPFYKEVTSGRDLVSDFRYYVTGSQYSTYLKWIL